MIAEQPATRRKCRLLAIAADGTRLAVRYAEGLVLVDAASRARTTLNIHGSVEDFVFAGRELLIAQRDRLLRINPATGVNTAELELPSSGDGARLRASGQGDASSAVLFAESMMMWLHDGAAIDLSTEIGAVVDVAFMHRELCFACETGIFSWSRGTPVRPVLDSIRGVVGIWSVFEGRALAVHSQTNPGAGQLALFDGSRRLVRSVPVPQDCRLWLSPKNGLAAWLLPSGDQLMLFDLRLGKPAGVEPMPLAICDATFTGDTETLLVAGYQHGCEELAVLEVPLRGETPVVTDAAAPRREDFAPAGEMGAEAEIFDAPVAVAIRKDGQPEFDAHAAHIANRVMLEDALCHATLLFERLVFLHRNLGLLPRMSTGDDPLGALVIADSDVNTVIAGFRKIAATAPEGRASLLADPCADALRSSREKLASHASGAGRWCGLLRTFETFALSPIQLDMLILAVAPELDLRMARLAGFLNNDAGKSRPRVGHLIMAVQEGLPTTDTLAWTALTQLLELELLVVERGSGMPESASSVRVPAHVLAAWLTGLKPTTQRGLGWDQLHWVSRDKHKLRATMLRELARPELARLLMISGPPGSGRASIARAAAIELGLEVEECALRATDSSEQLVEQVRAAAFRAKLLGRLLLLRSRDALRKSETLLPELSELCERWGVRALVTVREKEVDEQLSSLRFTRVTPPRFGPRGRRALWEESVAERRLNVAAGVLDDIAGRFNVTPGRIHELTSQLSSQSQAMTGDVTVGRLRETLRDITVAQLGNLAKRYESSVSLADLLFPRAVRERLSELRERVCHRHQVLGRWKFEDKAHESYGVSALFVGPSGTGKTAAAAALANALEVDLYVVDFSSIMSKWVGETEQNLAKIFDEAEASSVALLFDEADALFGKRSATQTSSSDRYANLTINYLLQRMESYSGLAILTTNLESAIDEAFGRRITTKIAFPPADDELRERLWAHLLPSQATYAEDVDLALLSREFALEGAHIRRALTRAAFRAAGRGASEPAITMQDLLWATAAEYEDRGRLAFERDPTTAPHIAAASGRH